MAVTQTTLNGAITADQLTIKVTSGSAGFPVAGGPVLTPGYLCRVDKEYFYAIQQPVANLIVIRGRGNNGGVAVAHDTLAKIEVSSDPSDFAQSPAGESQMLPSYLPTYATLGQDTTFTAAQVAAWGNQPQNFAITKASAAAITLVAPTKSQDGLTVTFTSLTDATHAITATSLFASAGAASPYTTATIANAKAGGGITLQAQNALWNVLNSLNWTLS